MAIEESDASSSPLFGLPEYDWAFAVFIQRAIDELMVQKSPLLSRIKRVPASSISISRNTMPSGEVIENQPVRMELPFLIKFDDAVTGALESIIVNIDIAAEEGLKIMMPRFYEYVGRLCTAAGTATHANGEKLSHDLLLKSFEKMELEFDDNGKPIMPTILTSPDMLQAFEALAPPTEEEANAWTTMIDRKRKAFNDRRRHRTLS